MMVERRRAGDFIERLSIILIAGAYIGGFIVLLDIKLWLTFWGQTIQIGSTGFSSEVKGVVLQSMLITGFAAVVGFWLGTTKQGQDQAQSVNKIAEASAPTTALAVAASRSDPLPPVPAAPGAPLQAATVNIESQSTVVTSPTGEKPP